MEDDYDNQPACSSIRMDAAADRRFPRDLVCLPGCQYRDMVPKCGRCVAHDEFYYLSPQVQIKYCVDPHRIKDFECAMYELRRMRERNGAFGWFMAHDPSDAQSHVEAFMAESWEEYLRQLEHMTNADHAIEKRAR